MTTATVVAAILTALPILGTVAGFIQRNSSGKTQRIAAACAALLVDVLKLSDAIRGVTNQDALLVPRPTTAPTVPEPK